MNTKSKTMKAVCFALVFALAFSAGAAKAWNMPKMFSLDNTWPFRDKDKPQEGTPVRMVGAWTDTVMTQGGQKPQRGFGGRLMFYDKDGKKPILVDGQLVVYAFDEAGRDPTDNKPTRRYVFPAEQMPIHMSKSEFGASYSFWLPWDEVGGPKTEVSLICRFEPKGGAVVTGEQTKHLLQGPELPAGAMAGANKPPKVPEGVPSKPPRQTLEEIQANRALDHRAQQTSYEAPIAGNQQGAVVNAAMQTGPMADRHLTATTIALPQNYQLPDAAALNSAMQSTGYQPAQMSPQLSPNAAQPQLLAAPTRTYSPAAPVPLNQLPMGTAQPYMGTQMPQQMPPGSPTLMVPGMQAPIGPMGLNAMPAYQVQQAQYQQPIVQQPMVQPPPIRQPQTMMQSWPQAQNQMGQPATASYPASVQYR
jgi:hypothetical protein